MFYCFEIFDVFIDMLMVGNFLVVVYEVDDLDDVVMQVIVVEFNLFEIVFIIEFCGCNVDWGVCIFMFKEELFFVGYLIVGLVIVLVLKVGGELGMCKCYVLEEIVGDIIVDVCINLVIYGFVCFFLLCLFECVVDILSLDWLFEVFGIELDCFLNMLLDMGVWLAGVLIGIVLVCYVEDLVWIQLNMFVFEVVFGGDILIQVYFVVKVSLMEYINDWCVCMFVLYLGIFEDLVIGGVVVVFMGFLVEQGGFGEGEMVLFVYQGIEMGCLSLLCFVLKLENGQFIDVMIGGDVVMIFCGELFQSRWMFVVCKVLLEKMMVVIMVLISIQVFRLCVKFGCSCWVVFQSRMNRKFIMFRVIGQMLMFSVRFVVVLLLGCLLSSEMLLVRLCNRNWMYKMLYVMIEWNMIVQKQVKILMVIVMVGLVSVMRILIFLLGQVWVIGLVLLRVIYMFMFSILLVF